MSLIEMFQPGVHISFSPCGDFWPDRKDRKYHVTVMRVEDMDTGTRLHVASCRIVEDGKAIFINALDGSVWGGDGEAYWGAWVTTIDLATGKVEKKHWGEMHVPMKVLYEDKTED